MSTIDRAATMGTVIAAVLMAAISSVAQAQSLDWQLVSDRDRSALEFAIAVGREDQLPLYACRVRAGAGVETGRFRNDFDGCHIGYGGKELSVTPFEVLAPAWQDAEDGTIPAGSFSAGGRVASSPTGRFGLSTLFPCRAAYKGNIHVGEVAAGDRGCSFGYGGRQVTEPHYQVLWQAPWMTWNAGIGHQLPPGAVPAGAESGELFYICRAADQTGLHPGKIKQSSPGCSIVSEGKEIVAQVFSVLVPRWVEGNAGTIPGAALPAGNERAALIYLCRTQMRTTLQIGKITEELASCRVGMMGVETNGQAYEVLSAR